MLCTLQVVRTSAEVLVGVVELGHPLSCPFQLGPGPSEKGMVGGTPVLQLAGLFLEVGDILGVGGRDVICQISYTDHIL